MSSDVSKKWISDAKAALARGEPQQSLELLRAAVQPGDGPAIQGVYARMARSLEGRIDGLRPLRIAFLGQVTLEHFVACLRYWLLLEGYRLEAYVAPFGTWRQEVRSDDAELYAFKPDIVWFFSHIMELPIDRGFYGEPAQAQRWVAATVGALADDVAIVAHRCHCQIIVNNLAPPSARIFGNLEGSSPGTFGGIVRGYNEALGTAIPSGSVVFDLAHLAMNFGLERWEDARLWLHSKHPFSMDANGHVAFAAARLLVAARGGAKKCIVVDLDNTLWGGVVGDDGVDGILIGPNNGLRGEAFRLFQQWLKGLAARGIALAVCSKNESETAKLPFTARSEMALSLDDFAAFRANWDNKADNIRAIAQTLNIGLDAIVFVDDNPAERALIRAELPMVAVPDLPEDPAAFIACISDGRWFETVAVSKEDREKTAMFRQNAMRKSAESNSTDLPTYLRSLDMVSTWGTPDESNTARIVQLFNKTNQFNLTTIRYSLDEIQQLANSPRHWVGWFSLVDTFGDNGIISAAVMSFSGSVATIESWVMSCRVFARTMEQYAFFVMARVARERGCTKLRGAYRASAKNAVVASLYQSLGGAYVQDGANGDAYWEFQNGANAVTSSPYIRGQ